MSTSAPGTSVLSSTAGTTTIPASRPDRIAASTLSVGSWAVAARTLTPAAPPTRLTRPAPGPRGAAAVARRPRGAQGEGGGKPAGRVSETPCQPHADDAVARTGH